MAAACPDGPESPGRARIVFIETPAVTKIDFLAGGVEETGQWRRTVSGPISPGSGSIAG